MSYKLPKHIIYWLSEAKHDCFFVVGPVDGPTERIGALKHLIMGMSEPFRAMLQESKLAEPGDIRLIDVEPETFWNFLRCVYGGSKIVIPKLSFGESAKLLYVVDKYLVENIRAKISNHLCKTWCPEKIFIALSQQLCLNEKRLQREIVDILKKGFQDISRHEEFLNVSENAIRWILQQEHLNVKELEIWMAILRWAKHKGKSNCGEILRLHIYPFVKYIRFLAMGCEDFYKHVVTSGILQREEVDEIIESFMTGNTPSCEYLCKSKTHRYETPKKSENIESSFLEISNGVFIYSTINNISGLNTWEYSEVVCLAGFAWQLMVCRSMQSNKNYLSVFLRFYNYTRGWPCPVELTCFTNFKFTLLNQSGKPDFNKYLTHEFNVEDRDWGWYKFLELDIVLDPARGFVKNNKIFLSARIHVNE